MNGERCATTHWSVVLLAGQSTTAESRHAFATLCERYWYPVYAYIRRQGHTADEAQDLTQEFFLRVLEKNYLHDVDPAKGRFRWFLLASIRHFLSNERDRSRSLKRGGGAGHVSLDFVLAENRHRLEPKHAMTPERLFDRHWALAVVERTLSGLRDESRSSSGAPEFDALAPYLTGEGTKSYRETASELAMTEGAVKVAVHRLRRRFRERLRDEIGQTVDNADEVEAEIQHLRSALAP